MSADLPLPKQVYGHGFLTVEGQKISKSLGNVIDPIAMVRRIRIPDAVRYALLSCTSFDQDGDFSKSELIRKANADLANNLGNLLNRTLTLIEKHCNGQVPKTNTYETLIVEAQTVCEKATEHIKRLEFAKAVEVVFALVDKTNKYLNDEKPWDLFKKEKQKEGEVVLYTVLEILRLSTILICPFVPNT